MSCISSFAELFKLEKSLFDKTRRYDWFKIDKNLQDDQSKGLHLHNKFRLRKQEAEIKFPIANIL